MSNWKIWKFAKRGYLKGIQCIKTSMPVIATNNHCLNTFKRPPHLYTDTVSFPWYLACIGGHWQWKTGPTTDAENQQPTWDKKKKKIQQTRLEAKNLLLTILLQAEVVKALITHLPKTWSRQRQTNISLHDLIKICPQNSLNTYQHISAINSLTLSVKNMSLTTTSDKAIL